MKYPFSPCLAFTGPLRVQATEVYGPGGRDADGADDSTVYNDQGACLAQGVLWKPAKQQAVQEEAMTLRPNPASEEVAYHYVVSSANGIIASGTLIKQ